MKLSNYLICFVSVISLAVTFGCGGSGGGDGGGDGGGSTTGTMSMSITDAKPVLPANVTNCFVKIDEVMVHKSGGGWETLPLVQTPYTIDLLQFSDGTSTELVPPVAVGAGKYTQIRLSVVSAKLRFNNNPNDEADLTIPSGNLKTDKNFDFDVTGTAAVDITIDFDLSKSIVVEGPAGSPSYKLKPVLHIVETTEAATIEGTVANTSFGDPGVPPDPPYVVITVFDSTGQEYTKVQVDKDTSVGATQTAYSIFWLVPDQDYTVEIDYDPVTGTLPVSDASKPVSAADLEPGETAIVNFP